MNAQDFPALLRNFESEARRLPYTADAVEDFGRTIQVCIGVAERAGHQDEALLLGMVILRAFQKFDQFRRAQA
jgi:hypothetical protein